MGTPLTGMIDCEGMSIEETIANVFPEILVRVPLKGHPDNTTVLDAPDTFGVYRVGKDTYQYLGSVGKQHEIVQPIDDFMRYQKVIDDGSLKIVRAGVISKGRTLVIQAKFNGFSADIGPNDTVEHWVTLAAGLAGNRSYGISDFDRRLWCNNQLHALQVAIKEGLSFRHTKGIHAKLEDWQVALESKKGNFEKTVEAYRAIAAKPIRNDKQIETYVDQVFEVDRTKEVSTKTENKIRYVCSLFDGQIEAEKVPASYWKVYNAVTQYLTHTHGHNEDNRLDSLLFGESARVSQRALQLAINA